MDDKLQNNKHTPLQQHIAERIEGIQITADTYEWAAHDWMSDGAHRHQAAEKAKKYRKAENALYGLPETGHAEGKQERTGKLVTLDKREDWLVAGGGVPDAHYPEEQTDEAIDDFIYRLWGEGWVYRLQEQNDVEEKKPERDQIQKIRIHKSGVPINGSEIRADTKEPLATPEQEESEPSINVSKIRINTEEPLATPGHEEDELGYMG